MLRPEGPTHPLIERVWHAESSSSSGIERVLPTGAMHVVLRLADAPLSLVEDGGLREVGHAVVGGARSSFYLRLVGGRSRSVGAMLKPGAARALFGASAEELAERHTPLADLWGRDAELLRDRLATSRDPLAVFVDALSRRLGSTTFDLPVDPETPVAELVRRSGYSHRAFTEKFRANVGLAPKAFAKVQRFQRALALLPSSPSLAEAAFAAGYADQAHMCRDFAALAGLSPAAYRRLAPASPNHVDFVQDARR